MTYNSGIPNSTDLISNSQAQLKTNFTQLNNQFGIDHSAYNTGSGNGTGFHKQVTLANVASPGAQVDPASIIYTKSVTGVISPYFMNSVGDSVIWRGGSGTGLVAATTGGNDSAGSLTLGNGVIYKWGSLSVNFATNQAYTFPVAFPNACFVVIPSCGAASGQTTESASIVNSTITKTGFTVKQSAGSSSRTVRYIAIGN